MCSVTLFLLVTPWYQQDVGPLSCVIHNTSFLIGPLLRDCGTNTQKTLICRIPEGYLSWIFEFSTSLEYYVLDRLGQPTVWCKVD
jgi:hypothetical protein